MDLAEWERRRVPVTTLHGEFAYVEAGEGPPAVFVHGLFVSGYVWKDVIDGVSDVRRCLAYHLAGHGGSRVPQGADVSLPAQADMLASFCDSLGLAEADFVANDTGGAVVQVMAVRRPDLVRTLVLTNCEARDVLPAPQPVPQMIFELAGQGMLAPLLLNTVTDLEFVRSDVSTAVGLQYPERLTMDDLRGLHAPHHSDLVGAREVERTVLALRAEDLAAVMDDLSRLDVPALLVWGTGDEFFTLELAHWLQSTLPDVRGLVLVEGGKLFWPLERPGELIAPLREFWGLPAAAGAGAAPA